MPTFVREIDSLRLIVVTLSGDVTLSDLRSIDTHLTSCKPEHDLFVVDEPRARITASAAELRDFAAADLVLSPASRRVIMASEDVMFGLSRMYSMTATPAESDVHVCKSLAEAAAVFGLTESQLRDATRRD